ncbi:MAG TPA: winged helix DNA-binding domain-containing protein [Gemmatimonadaceae bacterium]|nr:winged helix DNA-binding domain-containing protein [Gemmatimonadaceae bacterium]
MLERDIANQRLVNQGLVKPTLKKAVDVVATLGAVQAQDYGAAKWGLAQRTRGLTDDEIEEEIADGTIVRTHILRPTWHFVAAGDIGWMLALSAPRVHAANGYWYRWLEVDETVARRSGTALTKALRDGKQLTREELGQVLERAKIPVKSNQRLAAIMMRAELDGVICSGARRGKQFTYALLEERVPASAAMKRDEALAQLARRYFTTRGPATVDDFAWWSGLTKADSKRGVEAAAPQLERESILGKSHWLAAAGRRVRIPSPLAHLLPNYDEYFIGLKDRSAFSARLKASGVEARTDALGGHVLFIDGQIVGGWKRAVVNKTVVVAPNLLLRLSEAERGALGSEVQRFSEFLAIPVRIQQE